MQFQIEVISVGSPQTIPTKNGKSYQVIEVAYRKDGKIEGKKIMSFTNPAVFKALQNFEQGDTITVTAEKNDAGYWQWENVSKGEAQTSAAPAPVSAATQGGGTAKSTGGNWETKEERAAKQIMIVRQSSLSSAVNLLGNKAKASDVISIAKEFEAYVMGSEPKSAIQELTDMDDDIPM